MNDPFDIIESNLPLYKLAASFYLFTIVGYNIHTDIFFYIITVLFWYLIASCNWIIITNFFGDIITIGDWYQSTHLPIGLGWK